MDRKGARDRVAHEEGELTEHVQAVVLDPLLAVQRRVDGLAAQRRPVVFPLHRDADGAGNAEGLLVVLLGHDTWREAGMKRG